MNNQSLITVTPFSFIGQDERGTTAEITIERSGKALSIFRKEGTVFGNHYHSGTEPTKNPEIFWLLHGTLKVEYRALHSSTWEEVELSGPTKVDFYPNVIHRVTALSDTCMLELNSLQAHIDDTHRD
jgi:hypothetical protein